MSCDMAQQESQQNPNDSPSLFTFDAFAYPRGLGWDSVRGVIEAALIEVTNECRDIVVHDPRSLMISLTQNPTVAEWIPESAQEGVSFERFTQEILEPYILREVGRRFQEAQTQLQYFVENKLAHFQQQMVKIATAWMERVQRH